MSEKQRVPLNVIINQVENGFTVTETQFYRVGDQMFTRHLGDNSTIQKTWVAATPQQLGDLITKLCYETPVHVPAE